MVCAANEAASAWHEVGRLEEVSEVRVRSFWKRLRWSKAVAIYFTFAASAVNGSQALVRRK